MRADRAVLRIVSFVGGLSVPFDVRRFCQGHPASCRGVTDM